MAGNLDEKIKLYKRRDQLRRIIVEDSHPDDAVELQTHVLKYHTNVDRLILEAIRAFIWSTAYNNQSSTKLKLLSIVLFLCLSEVSYKRKLFILNLIFPGLKKTTKKAINDLNGLRNEFAHQELRFLASKYNYKNDTGKRNVLKAYEICENAEGGLIKDLETMEALSKYSSYAVKENNSKAE